MKSLQFAQTHSFTIPVKSKISWKSKSCINKRYFTQKRVQPADTNHDDRNRTRNCRVLHAIDSSVTNAEWGVQHLHFSTAMINVYIPKEKFKFVMIFIFPHCLISGEVKLFLTFTLGEQQLCYAVHHRSSSWEINDVLIVVVLFCDIIFCRT